MTAVVREWVADDTEALARVVIEVQEDSGYPARAHPSLAGAAEWLLTPEPLVRLVLESDRTVLGHVRVIEPRPYLVRFLADQLPDISPDDCLEIGQLFVAPSGQRRGGGRLLIDAALHRVWVSGRHALVAAIGPESTRRLYERVGFSALGTFMGADGQNTVMVRWHTP